MHSCPMLGFDRVFVLEFFLERRKTKRDLHTLYSVPFFFFSLTCFGFLLRRRITRFRMLFNVRLTETGDSLYRAVIATQLNPRPPGVRGGASSKRRRSSSGVHRFPPPHNAFLLLILLLSSTVRAASFFS